MKDELYPFEVTRYVRSWGDCAAGASSLTAVGRELMEKGLAVRLAGDYDSAVFEIAKVPVSVRHTVPSGDARVGFSLGKGVSAKDAPLRVE